MKMKFLICISILCILVGGVYMLPHDGFQKVNEFSQPVNSVGSWNCFRGNKSLTGWTNSLAKSYQLSWVFKAKTGIKSSPVIKENNVIVADEEGVVYAVDRRSGENVWSFATGNGIEAPALIVGDFVYIGNLNGDFFCLDLETGESRWTFKTNEQIYGSANIVEKSGKNVVVFGSYDFYLHALNVETGAELWKVKTGNYVNGAPAVDGEGGLAVFGGCDSWLRIVDVNKGVELNKYKADSYLPSSPVIDNGVVFVGSHNGVLIAVELHNANEKWRFASETKKPFLAPPAVNEKYVIIGNDRGELFIVDKKYRKLQKTLICRGEITAAPVVDNEKVLVADEEGWVYIFNLDTGKLLWEYCVGPSISSSPAVAGGEVVICDSDGNVYMFLTGKNKGE